MAQFNILVPIYRAFDSFLLCWSFTRSNVQWLKKKNSLKQAHLLFEEKKIWLINKTRQDKTHQIKFSRKATSGKSSESFCQWEWILMPGPRVCYIPWLGNAAGYISLSRSPRVWASPSGETGRKSFWMKGLSLIVCKWIKSWKGSYIIIFCTQTISRRPANPCWKINNHRNLLLSAKNCPTRVSLFLAARLGEQRPL